jgi:hypothetical protein
MTLEPCYVCGTAELLLSRWDSASGVGWVMCDKCGRISTAIPLDHGRDVIISQWNSEQEEAKR